MKKAMHASSVCQRNNLSTVKSNIDLFLKVS